MTFFRVVVVVLLTLLTVAALSIAYYLHSFYGIFTGSNSGGSSIRVTGEDEVGADNGAASTDRVADAVPASGFTVDITTLPETQQAMLRTLGYEKSVTFTPEMVSCAEAKLGSPRVTEIMAGAAPSMMESASLMACL